MLRLFTTWYPCGDAQRRAELAEALQRNLDCAALDQVCILREGAAELPLASDKLVVREATGRPTFDDFWAWMDEVNDADDLAIVANSDIWFDASIGLAKTHLSPGQCWALARWDCVQTPPVLFDRNDSQDAWVLRGQPRPINGDFFLGAPRCDNRLLYELQAAGYETRNPAFSVRAHHLHDREFAEYGGGVQPGFAEPPYRYLWPHNLLSRGDTAAHNATSPIKIEWRPDPRARERQLHRRAWRKLQSLIFPSP